MKHSRFHEDGYGDEDAIKTSFVKDVLLPAACLMGAALLGVLAFHGCRAEAASVAVESRADAVLSCGASLQLQSRQMDMASLKTPIPTPAAEVNAAFVADALAQAGLTDWTEPERMSPAGAMWARLNARLASRGPSPALKAAFISFFKSYAQ